MKLSLLVTIGLLLAVSESVVAVAPFGHNRHLQGNNNITDALFRRYLVNMRGTTSNADRCPPPQPSVSITCGSTLQLVDVDGSTTCTTTTMGMMNNSTINTTTMTMLNCTGTGRVLVDCIQDQEDDEEFLEELSFVSVELLTPQQEFECNFVNPSAFVGQALFIAVVCRDVSLDFTKIECLPEETFVDPPNGEPLCLERCTNSTTCTNADLQPLLAEVKDDDACYWDPAVSASPSASPAPSNAPSVSMAPSVSQMPSVSVAPTVTVSMAPSLLETSIETTMETNAPTFVLGGGGSSSNTTSGGGRRRDESILIMMIASVVVAVGVYYL